MSGQEQMGRAGIVTGASRGIGRAVALRLSREGARLVLVAREREDELARTAARCREEGAEAETLLADVGEEGAGEKLVAACLQRFGRLDILVNNAGVAPEGLLVGLRDPALATLVATNILGPVRLCRAALRPMLRQRSGCIVNLSSALARQAQPGSAAYAGSKAFLEAFTRSLAAEVGERGVRVNAVAPGFIETDMTAKLRQRAGGEIAGRLGLRRLGTPEEVAGAVAFLCSDAAAYVTGAVLSVDGGFLCG